MMTSPLSTSPFRPALRVGELSDPGRAVVEIDDRLILLIHAGGAYYALDDVCTHDGGPLGEGLLEGDAIACPRHGAKFNIRDGRPLTMPATKPTQVHEVRVEGDQVLVRLTN